MIETLCNFFRSVIVLTPDELLPCVYLCLNKLAPAYEGVELGIGETVLMKAIAQCTGKYSVTDNRRYPKYSDRQGRANSVDPDQMPQNAASDLSLHCLPLIQQFLDTSSGSQMDLFRCVRRSMFRKCVQIICKNTIIQAVLMQSSNGFSLTA